MRKEGRKKKDRIDWKEVLREKLKIDWKNVGNFFKPDKVSIKALLTIVIVAVGFQLWDYYNPTCLEVACRPVLLWIGYYLFWPFDFLSMLLLNYFLPERIILFIGRVILLLLQACYWYAASCAVAVPIKKIGLKLEELRKKRLEYEARALKEAITRDIKRAEELEEENRRSKR